MIDYKEALDQINALARINGMPSIYTLSEIDAVIHGAISLSSSFEKTLDRKFVDHRRTETLVAVNEAFEKIWNNEIKAEDNLNPRHTISDVWCSDDDIPSFVCKCTLLDFYGETVAGTIIAAKLAPRVYGKGRDDLIKEIKPHIRCTHSDWVFAYSTISGLTTRVKIIVNLAAIKGIAKKYQDK